MSDNDKDIANQGDKVFVATNYLLTEIRKIWTSFESSMSMENFPRDDARDERPTHHWEFRRLRAVARRRGKL